MQSFLAFMRNYSYSALNDCYYLFDGCIKIINLSQALFYVDRNVPIKDVYSSVNYQTGQKTLVFIVDKFESATAYNHWKKLHGQRFECRNIKEINEPDWLEVTNVQQIIFYLDQKAKIQRMAPIRESSGRQRLAFYFAKEETEDIYRKWLSSQKNSN